MTMGTQEERDVVSRLVNKAHVPVRSSGRYTAFDPDLQLWVAVTLAQNTWIHERVFGKFDAATREQVYRDSQVFGTALQVKPEDYPQTWADYQAYWRSEEHTSELQSLMRISYAVFCLKKKKTQQKTKTQN